MGLAKNVSHSAVTEGQKPISLRPYRRSIAAEQEVNEEISELIDQGLLIPLRSPWASPVLVAKKKDVTNCIVIDYCKLNSITKKDSYFFQRIDDTLDRLGGAQFFSSMDLVLGYWKIDLPEEDQEKCANITSSGLYQPTRMPQGCAMPPLHSKEQWTIFFQILNYCAFWST